MIETHDKRSALLLTIGFFFLNVVALSFFLAVATFAFHGSISAVHFPVVLVLACLIQFYVCKHYSVLGVNILRPAFAVCGVFLILALVTSGTFYDISYDGQAYHQEAIIQLKGGWNPFFQHLPDGSAHAIWINHYAKAAEISQAVVYACFNKIELGKATNFFLIIAAFSLTASFLFKLKSVKPFKVYLLSSLLLLNPVFVAQAFTYYVDIQLGLLLLCILAICGHLLIEPDKLCYYLLGIAIILAINIKFTGFVFVSVFLLATCYFLIANRHFRRLRLFLICVTVSSILAIGFGFNPYVTNTLNYGHPFYPLAGDHKIEIMKSNSPAEFFDQNRFKNLFVSLFSRTDNFVEVAVKHSELKVPLTFKVKEAVMSSNEDARIGGFGVLFSGILLISLVELAFTLSSMGSGSRLYFLGTLTALIVSTVIVPYCWWARYVPQFWFFPLIVLIGSECSSNKNDKFIKPLLYFLIFVNSSIAGGFTLLKNELATEEIRFKLAGFKSIPDNIQSVRFDDFPSGRVKFEENHIKIPHFNKDEGYIIKIKICHLTTRLKHAVSVKDPFLLKYYRMLVPKATTSSN